MASKKVKFPVVILQMKDEDGNEDVLAFRTDEEMRSYLYSYVSDNWDNVFDEDDHSIPEDKPSAIDDYYSSSSDDYEVWHRILEYEVLEIMEVVGQQHQAPEAAAPNPLMGNLITHEGH